MTDKKRQQTKEAKLSLLEEFYTKNMRAPKRNEIYKGVKIGFFYNSIKTGRTKTTQSQKERLESIGIDMSSINKKEMVHNKVNLLIKYYLENGKTPSFTEEYEGVKLGTFYTSIKCQDTNISDEDRQRLENVGISLKPFYNRDENHNKVLLVLKFYEENGRLPKVKEVYEGVRLMQFIYDVKFHQVNISDEDRKILDDIGINIKRKNVKAAVHNKVLLLIDFYKRNGRTPKFKETYEGVNIGTFFSNLKTKNTKISKEDASLLKNAGISLITDYNSSRIHKAALLLADFYKAKNRLPKINERYKKCRIGKFYYNIKNNNSVLSREDKKLLMDLGII